MTFPHVLRRDNTWGTPPKVHKSQQISPWQMDVDHDGHDATSDVGRLPGHVAACDRLVWHV
jgi:hypothetical protein